MGNIIFTKEEKEQIKKSLNLVLDDIRELWSVAETDKIYIEIGKYIQSDSQYYLYITNNKISIHYPCWDTTTKYNLETRAAKLVNRIPSDYELALSFIQNYETIRGVLLKEIKKGLKKKNLGFSAIEEINKKYNKDAEIEIDFPETINKHSIVVQEENGKKIGIINFGDRTIKIVTTGDIVLIDKTKTKEEQPKQTIKVKRNAKNKHSNKQKRNV